MDTPKNTHNPLKIIFAGTPDFAQYILDALLTNQHHICCVYTQPDRPAGRGRKLTPSPVKQLALQHHVEVRQPTSLKSSLEQEKLQSLDADLMIVAAYGLILPKPILNAPRLGCINVHASLLPRWRGASPIQSAILAGDETSGITMMQMDEGLDTGDMLQQVDCSIEANDTSQTLHNKLARLGAQASLALIDSLQQGKTLQPIKQEANLATHSHKIEKQQANLDWCDSAQQLQRTIRAFNPWPIAYTFIHDQRLRIWHSEIISNENKTTEKSGTILATTKQGIDIATGQGILRLLTLQLPGSKPLAAADILNAKGDLFKPGNILCSHEVSTAS